MERVTHRRTPDQIWGAHAEFWQKAVEAYGKEYMIVLRLLAGVASKSVAAAKSAAAAGESKPNPIVKNRVNNCRQPH
jgi:hypothetical protein